MSQKLPAFERLLRHSSINFENISGLMGMDFRESIWLEMYLNELYMTLLYEKVDPGRKDRIRRENESED